MNSGAGGAAVVGGVVVGGNSRNDDRYNDYARKLRRVAGLGSEHVVRDLLPLRDLPHREDPRREPSARLAREIEQSRGDPPLLCLGAEGSPPPWKLRRLVLAPSRAIPLSCARNVPNARDPRRAAVLKRGGYNEWTTGPPTLVDNPEVPAEEETNPVLTIDASDWPESKTCCIEIEPHECNVQRSQLAALGLCSDIEEDMRSVDTESEPQLSQRSNASSSDDEAARLYRQAPVPEDRPMMGLELDSEMDVCLEEQIVPGSRDQRQRTISEDGIVREDKPDPRMLLKRPLPRVDESGVETVDLCLDERDDKKRVKLETCKQSLDVSVEAIVDLSYEDNEDKNETRVTQSKAPVHDSDSEVIEIDDDDIAVPSTSAAGEQKKNSVDSSEKPAEIVIDLLDDSDDEDVGAGPSNQQVAVAVAESIEVHEKRRREIEEDERIELEAALAESRECRRIELEKQYEEFTQSIIGDLGTDKRTKSRHPEFDKHYGKFTQNISTILQASSQPDNLEEQLEKFYEEFTIAISGDRETQQQQTDANVNIDSSSRQIEETRRTSVHSASSSLEASLLQEDDELPSGSPALSSGTLEDLLLDEESNDNRIALSTSAENDERVDADTDTKTDAEADCEPLEKQIDDSSNADSEGPKVVQNVNIGESVVEGEPSVAACLPSSQEGSSPANNECDVAVEPESRISDFPVQRDSVKAPKADEEIPSIVPEPLSPSRKCTSDPIVKSSVSNVPSDEIAFETAAQKNNDEQSQADDEHSRSNAVNVNETVEVSTPSREKLNSSHAIDERSDIENVTNQALGEAANIRGNEASTAQSIKITPSRNLRTSRDSDEDFSLQFDEEEEDFFGESAKFTPASRIAATMGAAESAVSSTDVSADVPNLDVCKITSEASQVPVNTPENVIAALEMFENSTTPAADDEEEEEQFSEPGSIAVPCIAATTEDAESLADAADVASAEASNPEVCTTTEEKTDVEVDKNPAQTEESTTPASEMQENSTTPVINADEEKEELFSVPECSSTCISCIEATTTTTVGEESDVTAAHVVSAELPNLQVIEAKTDVETTQHPVVKTEESSIVAFKMLENSTAPVDEEQQRMQMETGCDFELNFTTDEDGKRDDSSGKVSPSLAAPLVEVVEESASSHMDIEVACQLQQGEEKTSVLPEHDEAAVASSVLAELISKCEDSEQDSVLQNCDSGEIGAISDEVHCSNSGDGETLENVVQANNMKDILKFNDFRVEQTNQVPAAVLDNENQDSPDINFKVDECKFYQIDSDAPLSSGKELASSANIGDSSSLDGASKIENAENCVAKLECNSTRPKVYKKRAENKIEILSERDHQYARLAERDINAGLKCEKTADKTEKQSDTVRPVNEVKDGAVFLTQDLDACKLDELETIDASSVRSPTVITPVASSVGSLHVRPVAPSNLVIARFEIEKETCEEGTVTSRTLVEFVDAGTKRKADESALDLVAVPKKKLKSIRLRPLANFNELGARGAKKLTKQTLIFELPSEFSKWCLLNAPRLFVGYNESLQRSEAFWGARYGHWNHKENEIPLINSKKGVTNNVENIHCSNISNSNTSNVVTSGEIVPGASLEQQSLQISDVPEDLMKIFQRRHSLPVMSFSTQQKLCKRPRSSSTDLVVLTGHSTQTNKRKIDQFNKTPSSKQMTATRRSETMDSSSSVGYVQSVPELDDILNNQPLVSKPKPVMVIKSDFLKGREKKRQSCSGDSTSTEPRDHGPSKRQKTGYDDTDMVYNNHHKSSRPQPKIISRCYELSEKISLQVNSFPPIEENEFDDDDDDTEMGLTIDIADYRDSSQRTENISEIPVTSAKSGYEMNKTEKRISNSATDIKTNTFYSDNNLKNPLEFAKRSTKEELDINENSKKDLNPLKTTSSSHNSIGRQPLIKALENLDTRESASKSKVQKSSARHYDHECFANISPSSYSTCQEPLKEEIPFISKLEVQTSLNSQNLKQNSSSVSTTPSLNSGTCKQPSTQSNSDIPQSKVQVSSGIANHKHCSSYTKFTSTPTSGTYKQPATDWHNDVPKSKVQKTLNNQSDSCEFRSITLSNNDTARKNQSKHSNVDIPSSKVQKSSDIPNSRNCSAKVPSVLNDGVLIQPVKNLNVDAAKSKVQRSLDNREHTKKSSLTKTNAAPSYDLCKQLSRHSNGDAKKPDALKTDIQNPTFTSCSAKIESIPNDSIRKLPLKKPDDHAPTSKVQKTVDNQTFKQPVPREQSCSTKSNSLGINDGISKQPVIDLNLNATKSKLQRFPDNDKHEKGVSSALNDGVSKQSPRDLNANPLKLKVPKISDSEKPTHKFSSVKVISHSSNNGASRQPLKDSTVIASNSKLQNTLNNQNSKSKSSSSNAKSCINDGLNRQPIGKSCKDNLESRVQKSSSGKNLKYGSVSTAALSEKGDTFPSCSNDQICKKSDSGNLNILSSAVKKSDSDITKSRRSSTSREGEARKKKKKEKKMDKEIRIHLFGEDSDSDDSSNAICKKDSSEKTSSRSLGSDDGLSNDKRFPVLESQKSDMKVEDCSQHDANVGDSTAVIPSQDSLDPTTDTKKDDISTKVRETSDHAQNNAEEAVIDLVEGDFDYLSQFIGHDDYDSGYNNDEEESKEPEEHVIQKEVVDQSKNLHKSENQSETSMSENSHNLKNLPSSYDRCIDTLLSREINDAHVTGENASHCPTDRDEEADEIIILEENSSIAHLPKMVKVEPCTSVESAKEPDVIILSDSDEEDDPKPSTSCCSTSRLEMKIEKESSGDERSDVAEAANFNEVSQMVDSFEPAQTNEISETSKQSQVSEGPELTRQKTSSVSESDDTTVIQPAPISASSRSSEESEPIRHEVSVPAESVKTSVIQPASISASSRSSEESEPIRHEVSVPAESVETTVIQPAPITASARTSDSFRDQILDIIATCCDESIEMPSDDPTTSTSDTPHPAPVRKTPETSTSVLESVQVTNSESVTLSLNVSSPKEHFQRSQSNTPASCQRVKTPLEVVGKDPNDPLVCEVLNLVKEDVAPENVKVEVIDTDQEMPEQVDEDLQKLQEELQNETNHLANVYIRDEAETCQPRSSSAVEELKKCMDKFNVHFVDVEPAPRPAPETRSLRVRSFANEKFSNVSNSEPVASTSSSQLASTLQQSSINAGCRVPNAAVVGPMPQPQPGPSSASTQSASTRLNMKPIQPLPSGLEAPFGIFCNGLLHFMQAALFTVRNPLTSTPQHAVYASQMNDFNYALVFEITECSIFNLPFSNISPNTEEFQTIVKYRYSLLNELIQCLSDLKKHDSRELSSHKLETYGVLDRACFNLQILVTTIAQCVHSLTMLTNGKNRKAMITLIMQTLSARFGPFCLQQLMDLDNVMNYYDGMVKLGMFSQSAHEMQPFIRFNPTVRVPNGLPNSYSPPLSGGALNQKVFEQICHLVQSCIKYSESLPSDDQNKLRSNPVQNSAPQGERSSINSASTARVMHSSPAQASTSTCPDQSPSSNAVVSIKKETDASAVVSVSQHCLMCGKQSELVCDNCKRASYCSKECQERHWRKRHHKKCKPVDTAQSSTSTSSSV